MKTVDNYFSGIRENSGNYFFEFDKTVVSPKEIKVIGDELRITLLR